MRNPNFITNPCLIRLGRCLFEPNRARFIVPSCRYRSSTAGDRRPYFITTPIFYVNAAPHIGHLYTCVLADAAARWQRILGNDVIFTTGTDEHGLKIQQAAEASNQDPLQLSNQVSAQFKSMFDEADISYTDYIRTTEPRHMEAVCHFWNRLQDQGYIYKGKYEGWYSVSDEAFVSNTDVTDVTTEDGKQKKVSIESGHEVVWMEEENYMFRMSQFSEQLTAWLDKQVIQPELFESDVRRVVSSLRDVSVSRTRDRLSWGIPVPGDSSQTIYVWLDALVNYLTVAGYPNTDLHWPPDYQVVGKDILKFHAVYWPTFLMAAGLEPPRKLLCHSHWTVDGVKMSKSLGNVVDPMDRMEKYTPDGFRFALFRGVPSLDGNYCDDIMVEYINSELANKVGNLLNRVTATKLNPDQIFPRKQQDMYLKRFTATDRETFENLDTLIDAVGESYETLHFYRGIDSIMSYIRWANTLVQLHEPWILVKSKNPDDLDHLKTLLNMVLETLRVSSILLQPIVPSISRRILDRLGIPEEKRTVQDAKRPYLNSPDRLPLGPNKGVILSRITR